MRWYTNNSYAKVDKSGNKTFLKKEPVRRKTDGFHAFLAALYKREEIQDVDLEGFFDMMENWDF
jgi:phage terminase large subunit-like protein